MTAILWEEAWFDMLWASWFEICTSKWIPDKDILTQTEFLDAFREIKNSVKIPVIIDADTGGTLEQLKRMITFYNQIWIDWICIEDKKFPKTNSFIEKWQELEEIDLFCKKIKLLSKEFSGMIFARIEALIAGKWEDEAIKRAKEYIKAGANVILIHSKSETPDEIVSFCRRYKKEWLTIPIAIIPTKYTSFTENYIKKYPQIKYVIYANQWIRSSIKAIKETYKKILKDWGVNNLNISTLDDCFKIQWL